MVEGIKWMSWKSVPEYMKEAFRKGEIVWEGDYLHTSKCRKCGREYWTIIHETTGVCPECEKNERSD